MGRYFEEVVPVAGGAESGHQPETEQVAPEADGAVHVAGGHSQMIHPIILDHAAPPVERNDRSASVIETDEESNGHTLDLGADLFDSFLDISLSPGTFYNGGVVLGNGNFLRLAEHLRGGVHQLEARLLRDSGVLDRAPVLICTCRDLTGKGC